MTTYIGIDVSMDKLHVAYQSSQQWQMQEITNQIADITYWLEHLPLDFHVVFEYTGTYSHRLAYCLTLAQKPFTIITPSQSKGFSDSLKKQAKTDRQDAKTLALFGVAMQPEPTELIDESMHQKRQLYQHYYSLKIQKQAINNQLHALSFDPRANLKVVEGLQQQLAFYQSQINDFHQQLFDINDDDVASIKELLLSIKGIGEVVAKELILATNGFKNFSSSKKFAKFVGLAPTVRQSGSSVKKTGKIPRTACSTLRASIFSAARSAARFNNDCKALFLRLRAKGKPYKVALIAVAHKLLRQAFAVVKSQVAFDNNFNLAK